MNICIITNLFPPIQTGSSYWARDLSSALAKTCNRVIVITRGSQNKVTIENEDGIVIYRLPAAFKLPKIRLFLNFNQFYSLFTWKNVRRIKEIVRRHDIELIHQCGQLLDSVLIASIISRQMHIPAVCSIHTKIYHPVNKLYNFLLQSVDRFILGKFVIPNFRALLAVDKTLADYCKKIYPRNKTLIIPVCINLLEADPQRNSDHKTNVFNILSIGHVTEMRDRSQLIEAVSALLKKGYLLHLTIAGKILTDKTVALISSLRVGANVTLSGEVPRQKLKEMLSTADLEAHWIDIPAIGSAGVEAMGYGTPILAYADEGIYGNVPLRNWENIVFIDPSDPNSLINGIERLIKDPELCARIGKNAKHLVKDHLTWDAVIPIINETYKEVVDKKI